MHHMPMLIPYQPIHQQNQHCLPLCVRILHHLRKQSAEPLSEESLMQEVGWLEISDELLDSEFCKSWSQHHALMNRCEEIYPGINAILPLITKEVHTIETQYHCIISFL